MKPETWNLKLPPAVEATMLRLEQALAQRRVVERLWARDASLWHPSAETQAGITKRLGWLDAPDTQLAQARAIATATTAPALLIAPDDAGAAARLWHNHTGALHLLDTWAPTEVQSIRGQTWSAVLIAGDRRSPALEQLLRELDGLPAATRISAIAPPALFERVGTRAPEIVAVANAGARFGALNGYGLIAAALAGRDLDAMMRGARGALDACRGAPGRNPGLRLGAALAALAQHEYDLLWLDADADGRRVGEWIADLLAGALSKHRRGFVPLVAAAGHLPPPGSNSAHLVLRQPGSLAAEPSAPRIEFGIADDATSGALVAVWQVAIAIAAVVLGVNPFDEPDTIAFEQRMRRRLTGSRPTDVEADALSDAAGLSSIPATARWLALVPYFAARSHAAGLDRLRATLEQQTAKPVALVEPLRHGWATQLLHAGRPDGYIVALAPPVGDTELDELVRARFELDIQAWRRMERSFAVVEDF